MPILDHVPHWVKKTYIAPKLLASLRERSHRKQYYNQKIEDPASIKPGVIFMVDGRFIHGGLSDRFWGLISTWLACKKHEVDFKANWVWPFRLTTFLQPAYYDWTISPDDIVYDKRYATPVFVNNNHNEKNQWRLLDRAVKTGKKQAHVYSPAHIDRDNFGENFAKLFKPTPLLAAAIAKQKKAIGRTYVSVTFRFQQLLGDFKEGNYPTLAPDKQEELLNKSIETIKRVRHDNPGVDRVLVTSDSRRLLEAAQKLPYVYIIPGELVHMSYTEGGESELKHLKAFLDFFMIAGAKKVYFAIAPGIYRSTFAYTASLLYKAPYEEIEIN